MLTLNPSFRPSFLPSFFPSFFPSFLTFFRSTTWTATASTVQSNSYCTFLFSSSSFLLSFLLSSSSDVLFLKMERPTIVFGRFSGAEQAFYSRNIGQGTFGQIVVPLLADTAILHFLNSSAHGQVPGTQAAPRALQTLLGSSNPAVYSVDTERTELLDINNDTRRDLVRVYSVSDIFVVVWIDLERYQDGNRRNMKDKEER